MSSAGFPPLYDSSKLSNIYPNPQTVVNLGNPIVTAALLSLIPESSLPLFSLPGRITSISYAFVKGQYYKVAIDIAAFAALFFESGYLLSMGLDFTAELINYYLNRPDARGSSGALAPGGAARAHRGGAPAITRKDPTIPANAAQILSIPPDKLKDINLIRERYTSIRANIVRRKLQLPSTSPHHADFVQIIADVDTAFQTLTTVEGE